MSAGNLQLPRLLIFIGFAFGVGGCSRPADREAKFLQRGKALIQKGQYARASLEFKNAIMAMPKDAEPHFQLALSYMAEGNLVAAIPALRKATELNPKHVDAQLKLASLMAASSQEQIIENAQERLKGVLAIVPDNPDALGALAVTEWRLGEIKEALAHLEKAFEKSSESLQTGLNLAKAKMARRDTAGAEETLKKVAAKTPQSAPAALALAQFYVSTGQIAEAESQTRRALKLDSKNPTGLILLAALQLQARQSDQAEQTYRELSSLKDAKFKTVYALFLYREGKHREAIVELEKIVRQNQDNRGFRTLLVRAYMAQARYAEAEKILIASVKRNAKDVDALLQRAELYLRAGKHAEAEQDIQLVLHYEPNSSTAHYVLAKIHRFRGSGPLQQELREALRLNPNLLPARADLSETLVRNKSAQAALALLDQTPKTQKSTVDYLVARNWVLLALDDRESVQKNLQNALAVARLPELIYQDALLKLRRKDFPGARRSLEELQQRYPESPEPLELLAVSYSSQGDVGKALAVLREHAAQRPGSARLQNLLGAWLARADKRSEARAAFANARKADPSYLSPAFALAELDFTDGNLAAARQNVAPVVARHPDNIQARLLLAKVEDKAGNIAAAIEQYRAVVQMDSGNALALNNLACDLTRDSNLDEALKYATKALELVPDNPGIRDTLGWIYYRKGIYGTALTYLKPAAGAEAPIRKYHLGLTYLKVGERALGMTNIAAALREDPSLAITEPDSVLDKNSR